MIESAGSKGRILLADLHALRARCLAAGNTLPGRVVVKMFLDHFRTTDDIQFYRDYKHLEHLEFNHSHPDLFMSKWRELVSKVDRSMIPDKMLLSIFLNKVRKFPGIAWDVETFERAPDNSPQKTYKFLVQAMDAHIERGLGIALWCRERMS